MGLGRAWPAVFFLVFQTLVRSAYAQVPLDRLQDFLQATRARRPLERGSLSVAPGRLGLLPAASAGARWVPLGGRHVAVRVAHAQRVAWAASMPDATWAPPLHLLMDRARTSLGLEAAVQRSQAGTGQGVVIGIVDAGVDASHPDLRNADGTTRVAWWIDFSSAPAGLHPELEAAFGCEAQAGLTCRILDAADLNALLAADSQQGTVPDAIGHGTHIASIAAGNGRAGADAAFAGIAPEATLIVARVVGATGAIAETDVALATRFVFERASELGMPAVVNLSLGGDFGAHDGSSELSQQLSSFVRCAAGPGHRGCGRQ
jgi:subtilisin family serine protease